MRVGSFDDDYSPPRNAYKREQEEITNKLVTHPVIMGADLEGSGVPSADSPLRPVNALWPISTKDWRGSAIPNETVQLYLNSRQGDFCTNAIAEAATLGDQLINEYGSYQFAARAIQEYMRRHKDHLWMTASEVTFDNLELSQRLVDIHTVGAIPLFRVPTTQGLRCRGFPYDHSETEFILSRFWKNDGKGRLITASARAILETDKIICFPTTTVRKRLPDRRWSEERRPIWDGRLPNLFIRKDDYFSPVLPTIKDIADHIISLKRAYPNVPLKCTKRDINAAFRQIRLHPDACALLPTEFCGLHMGLDFDLIIGYLVLPFGWTGAPGVFAIIAETITRYHTLICPSNCLWAGDQNFRSHLFADDGILIEPDLPDRLEQSAAVWEEGSFMVIGDDAMNAEKLGIEGLWSSKQIVLGYELDLELFAITLPDEKNNRGSNSSGLGCIWSRNPYSNFTRHSRIAWQHDSLGRAQLYLAFLR